ncbi:MAG: UDP-N-acetylmuramate--L-alanine ligase [Candidatus Pacebacteria bacterium]|nr:UDP-N-acetylmuramate--L-alanine ligase [Candidatus Paceibacterota bacterium]
MPFESHHSIHLVGIKGVAMTSLAQCLTDLGKEITGSDLVENFVTANILKKLSVNMYNEFSPKNIGVKTDLVIYSGAHQGSQNADVLTAIQRGIPVLSHADALGELMKGKRGISVCGVGGKSTVSAMIAWILEYAGLHPSFSIGVGNVFNLNATGRYVPASDFFVAEADEYVKDPAKDRTPRFLSQFPECIVCTNIAFDHPDVYSSFDDTKKAYLQFFSHLPPTGTLIINGEDAELVRLTELSPPPFHRVIVSREKRADIQLGEYRTKKDMTSLDITVRGQTQNIRLHLPGIFNQMNAAYALAAASTCGVSIERGIEALEKFTGTMRRFENKGMKKDVQYYDDYAHHPSEIQATLGALREWYPDSRIVAVFQPHTYSRTKALLNEFSQSFSHADIVFLLDIFASAREKDDATVHADHLVQKIGKKAKNVHTIQEAVRVIHELVKPRDVVITLGAGDLYHIHDLC